MTFEACLVLVGTPEPPFAPVPISRVRVDPEAAHGAVALQAYLPVGMAGLTRSEVFSRFPCMFCRPPIHRHEAVGVTCRTLGSVENRMVRATLLDIDVGKAPSMRQNHQIIGIEFVVACLTEGLCIVAAIAAPAGVISSFYRMDFFPVGAVGFRHVIGSKCGDMEISVYASSLVTVETERLLVAVLAVVRIFLGIQPVLLHP